MSDQSPVRVPLQKSTVKAVAERLIFGWSGDGSGSGYGYGSGDGDGDGSGSGDGSGYGYGDGGER